MGSRKSTTVVYFIFRIVKKFSQAWWAFKLGVKNHSVFPKHDLWCAVRSVEPHTNQSVETKCRPYTKISPYCELLIHKKISSVSTSLIIHSFSATIYNLRAVRGRKKSWKLWCIFFSKFKLEKRLKSNGSTSQTSRTSNCSEGGDLVVRVRGQSEKFPKRKQKHFRLQIKGKTLLFCLIFLYLLISKKSIPKVISEFRLT